MIPSVTTALVLALIAPVQWMVDLLHPILLFFHDSIGVGWGMSIVLLTVCVRALLAPLTVKQFRSMQSMVAVAPELKALQTKYKDDKQRQQQEVMKFYAENKINPFASCLPLIAQMPFFIGLFYLLQTDLREDICGAAAVATQAVKKIPCAQVPGAITGSEDFLFIPDLTVKATGWVLAVLIVMYICSQLLSSLLTPSTADRTQRMIMYGLPFVFVFFIFTFPAGLIVYWITTNLWTVCQGYVLRKRLGPVSPPPGTPVPARAAVATGPGDRGGGFMSRLASITSSAASKGDGDEKAAAGGGSSSKPAAAAKAKARTPATAGAGGGGAGTAKSSGRASRGTAKSSTTAEPAAKPTRSGPPPPPPRKKKKRSGRRR